MNPLISTTDSARASCSRNPDNEEIRKSSTESCKISPSQNNGQTNLVSIESSREALQKKTRELSSYSITSGVKGSTSGLPEDNLRTIHAKLDYFISVTKVLCINEKFTKSMADDLVKYLETIKSVALGYIPEKMNFPEFYTFRFPTKGLEGKKIRDDKDISKVYRDALNDPVHYTMLNAQSVMKSDVGISAIVSKAFATQLYECISHLSPNIIELCCGRGMLSAAISAIKPDDSGGMFFATDKAEQEFLWEGVLFKQQSGEKVTSDPEHRDAYMDITYVSLNPDYDMLMNVIDQGNPLFIVNIGSQYRLSEMPDKQVKVTELAIDGYSTLIDNASVSLLAINMPESDLQKKLAMIPEKYRK